MTQHQCPVCSHSLTSLSLLQTHVELHFQDNPPTIPLLEENMGSQGDGVEIIRDESGRVIYDSRLESGVGGREVEDDECGDDGNGEVSERGMSVTHSALAMNDSDNSEADVTCVICGSSMIDMSTKEKNNHLNECLDAIGDKDCATIPIDAGEGGNRNSSDVWWTEIDGDLEKVPKNYSPGIIPVLQKILTNSYNQGVTRHAVLCSADVVHIQGQRGFDGGWGCGYRNAMMALTSVFPSNPQYQSIYAPSGSDGGPGVQKLQVWLEEAWKEGFDLEGKQQLKGKVVGTNKWIGTSDIYTVFSRQGIPCKLYDFPKASGAKFFSASSTHSALVAFVRTYFDGPDHNGDSGSVSSTSAFDVLMKSEGTSSTKNVRITRKMPLILQHSGHSRTIVGYEENKQGNTNILMYDPGRPMRSDIRRSGIDGLKEKGSGIVRDDEEDETVPPHRRLYTQVEIDAQAATFESDDEDTEPYQQPLTNVNREPSMDANEQPPLKRSRSDDKQSILRSDEKITKKGWIKKKTRQMPLRISSQNVPIKPAEKNKGPQAWMAKPVQALAGFRVNLSMLSRNTEYQVLMFTGGPLLTPAQQQIRKKVHGTAIYK